MTALLAATLLLAAARSAVAVPGVGELPVHSPAGGGEPRAVALVLAEPGSGPSAAGLAAGLAARGVLAIEVELARLPPPAHGRCWYPAGQLESIAQDAEKRLGLPEYLRPTLVGEGLGASVAWAALEQAPRGTFAGAVLGGLCPRRELPAAPCGGGGQPAGAERRIAPGPAGAPVSVLATAGDARCAPAEARAFAEAIPGATFEEGPEESRPGAAAGAVLRAAGPPGAAPPAAPPAAPASIADLPVVEVPARAAGRRLAVLLSGDGGWVGIDEGVAGALADAGVAVAGLDSLKYFWRRRTPEETAAAVGRIVAHYRARWGRDEVVLVGYSRGADIVPLLPPRLPPEARAALRGLALLGPGTFAELEVHVVDLFSSKRRDDAVSTEAAVRALPEGLAVLCVQGADEHDSLCPLVEARPGVRRVVLPGGHHFDRDYAKLARLVLDLR